MMLSPMRRSEVNEISPASPKLGKRDGPTPWACDKGKGSANIVAHSRAARGTHKQRRIHRAKAKGLFMTV
jgi:hypothetical protein